MLRTFRHGTHPPANKVTQDMPLVEFEVPEVLFVPLSQHIGAPAKLLVCEGDHVLEGQLIAEAGGFVSAPVFAPVSGEVGKVVKLPTAPGGQCDCVEIKNDFNYEKQYLPVIENPTKDDVLNRVKEAGIVGMGGATFPTHVKLSPSKKVDTLIINAAECEPYITCDYRLLLEETDTFIKGVKLLMLALGVSKAYIGIESNKPKAIAKLIEKVPENIFIMKLKTKYPQGAEKQLIYSVTRRIVPTGGLPMDVGCVVSNVHTAFAVAKAVYEGQPLYRRAMTVSGGGVERIGNYWVRGGIPYQFIYDKLKGNRDENITKKVISGGPMMGFAQANLKTPTNKGSSSLLFLTDGEFSEEPTTECINCGKCIHNCPMNLLPKDIEHALLKKDYQTTFNLGVMNCIECGVCSYSCPAKRPLVQAMRLAKKEIKLRGIK